MLRYPVPSQDFEARHNAVFDVLLTAYAYLPIWKKFKIVDKAYESARFYEAFVSLYENIKKMTLIDKYKWGDFMPESNPAQQWDAWAQEARFFLVDMDSYTESVISINTVHDWSRANPDVASEFSGYMKDFVRGMDICAMYDAVWPTVGLNYRTFELDAFINKHMKEIVYRDRETYSQLPPVGWLND